MEDRDYLELLVAKVSKLEKSIEELKATMESHKAEHGFDKMQPGGINKNFGQDNNTPQGMPMGGPPGMGGGMDRGYGAPGMGSPMSDPSMPPGM